MSYRVVVVLGEKFINILTNFSKIFKYLSRNKSSNTLPHHVRRFRHIGQKNFTLRSQGFRTTKIQEDAPTSNSKTFKTQF